ncbi:hypothetical protein GUJ93_ZPchr0001g30509 [Zizania palustris]|uniref:Uncharacterized protein n=1 Tax=Zizania palustris TaxID=103762 RepID=A0A8J5RJZ1_ZIZPA|nr:hypothetical protein GUJ93_ZPchr0001g30509 [Zizania palustris]
MARSLHLSPSSRCLFALSARSMDHFVPAMLIRPGSRPGAGRGKAYRFARVIATDRGANLPNCCAYVLRTGTHQSSPPIARSHPVRPYVTRTPGRFAATGSGSRTMDGCHRVIFEGAVNSEMTQNGTVLCSNRGSNMNWGYLTISSTKISG